MRIWRAVLLSLVLFAVALLYAKVSTTYFCSYDDFDELHRAAFQDHGDPMGMFTTPHWRSYKYRPLNRATNYLTYLVGSGSAPAFRVRNLVFHLFNVGLILIIALQLSFSFRQAVLAALIFGIHPMANQAVIGAVMTNTMAYTAYFGAFAAYLASVGRVGTYSVRWILLSIVAAAIALYLYDSTIVIFGLILWAVIEHKFRRGKWPLELRTGVAAIIAVGFVILSYGAIRIFVLPPGNPGATGEVPTIFTVIRNLGLYSVALINPFDLVLAHGWFGTPLPPEILQRPSLSIGVVVATLLALCGLILFWIRLLPVRNWAIYPESALLLIVGIVLPVFPVLVLSSHPSETYLYPSAAFFALLLISITGASIHRLEVPQRRVMSACFIVLIGVYGAATWERNNRVYECGVVAQRIITSSTAGNESTVFLADVESSDTPPYGYYRFEGLSTIGDRGRTQTAMTHALQLVTGDIRMQAVVVDEVTLKQECPTDPDTTCLFVYPDGRVTRRSH